MARRVVSKITANGCEVLEPATELQKAAFAEMLACRQPPRSQTDVEFFRGHTNPDADFLRKMTKRRYGFTPGPNDVYVSQLCRHGMAFDPLAWVPPTGGRGHIKKVLQNTGRGCHGLVNVDAPADLGPPPEPVPLAPDVIRDQAVRMVKENPDLRHVKKSELVGMVLERHGPKSS